MLRGIWKNELIHWYYVQNENDSLLAYLTRSTDFNDIELVFFEQLKRKAFNEANAILSRLESENNDDLQQFANLNEITLNLSQNNLSIKEVDAGSLALINEYSHSERPIGAQARTMLSQIIDSIQTLEIPNDTSFNRLSERFVALHQFILSPNPAKEETTIKLSDELSGDYFIEIVDIVGDVKDRMHIFKPQGQTISLNKLVSGNYIINLLSDERILESQKIIIIK